MREDQPRTVARAQPPAMEQGVDPRYYLLLLWRRPWWVVICCIAAGLLGALHINRSQPVYMTFTDLKYESNRITLSNFADPSAAALPDEIETQIQIIQSPRIIQRVVDSLGLNAPSVTEEEPPAKTSPGVAQRITDWKNQLSRKLISFEVKPLDPEVKSRQDLHSKIAGSLRVSRIGDTRVIRIRYSNPDAEEAARITDEFARQYIASLQEEKISAYDETKGFLNKRILEAKAQWENAERALRSYKGETDIRVLEQNYQIATNTMHTISEEIQKLTTEQATLSAKQKTAADASLVRSLLAEDPRFEALIGNLRELELERVPLLMENTESHPEVVRIDREIAVLKGQLESAAGELRNDLRAQEEILKINLASLRERLASQEILVEKIQQEMIQYQVLERDVTSSRELYDALLENAKSIDVSSEIGAQAYVTVLSPAEIPEYPDSPRIMQTLALFMATGFLIGVGIVLGADRLDRSVKQPEEIENALSLATLGMIPHLGGGFLSRGVKNGLITDPASKEAESFRVVRTALQYSRGGQPPKAILVTSALPKEGKSTVAANLAISYAQRGDKTLLIDCDLKRPTAHRLFDRERSPGVSDVLTGQKSEDEIVSPSGFDNLDLMTAGPAAPSPSDLLESKAMKEFLARMRESYNIIIIDSAPLSGMADSLVLSALCDGVCLLANRGKTPTAAFKKSVALLDHVEAPLLGVIYNHRDRGRRMGSVDYSAYYGGSYHYQGAGARE